METKNIQQQVSVPVKLIRSYLIIDFTDNNWLQRLWLLVRFIMVGKSRLPVGWKLQPVQVTGEETQCQNKEDTLSNNVLKSQKQISEKDKSS